MDQSNERMLRISRCHLQRIRKRLNALSADKQGAEKTSLTGMFASCKNLNRDLLMEVLQGVLSDDYSVRCATTVEEACAFLRMSVVDLVLLDSVLPDGSGDDVMGLAEKLGVSVITMSGYPRYECLGSRHGHLSKPFSVYTMQNEVQATLKQRASRSNG